MDFGSKSFLWQQTYFGGASIRKCIVASRRRILPPISFWRQKWVETHVGGGSFQKSILASAPAANFFWLQACMQIYFGGGPGRKSLLMVDLSGGHTPPEIYFGKTMGREFILAADEDGNLWFAADATRNLFRRLIRLEDYLWRRTQL